MSASETKLKKKYDAVVIPGGGLDHELGIPSKWVIARLDCALELDGQTEMYIVLSRGTPHRAPPSDGGGHPIDESVASARYLVSRGVASERIVMDRWSLDTIGNAYFLRTSIVEPLKLTRLCTVTSAFHMSRTRTVFDWVFSLDANAYSLDYKVSEDVGMDDDVLNARRDKEQQSVVKLREKTIPEIRSMKQLAHFVLVDHGAYNTGGISKERQGSCSTEAVGSY